MMRLNQPTYDLTQTLNLCCAGIVGNSDLLDRVQNSLNELGKQSVEYENRGGCSEIYQIKDLPDIPVGCALVGELTYSDLLKLYSYYLRNKEKPARKVYDSLMAAAHGQCPYCGGIGTPRNLDHFLPKSKFPQFSTLPINLVPSCRDCNMDGKGEDFATSANDQIINPYIAQNCFFDEQWIFATFSQSSNELPEFEYYVDAPTSWSDTDKSIAESHFERFEIAKQYAIESGSHYVEILAQVEEWGRTVDLPMDEIRETTLQPVINNSKFKNQWKRIMYQALLNSSWPS